MGRVWNIDRNYISLVYVAGSGEPPRLLLLGGINFKRIRDFPGTSCMLVTATRSRLMMQDSVGEFTTCNKRMFIFLILHCHISLYTCAYTRWSVCVCMKQKISYLSPTYPIRGLNPGRYFPAAAKSRHSWITLAASCSIMGSSVDAPRGGHPAAMVVVDVIESSLPGASWGKGAGGEMIFISFMKLSLLYGGLANNKEIK